MCIYFMYQNRQSSLPRYQSVNERSSGNGTTNSICTTPTLLPVAISMQGSTNMQPSFSQSSPLDDFRGSYTITDDEC